MSKPTVTDRYVKQALNRFVKKTEKLYEDNFPHKSAQGAFWERLSVIDQKLTSLLSERPLTRREIDSLCNRAFASLRQALISFAGQIEQPKFRKCTSIETGETRLIPDG